MLDSAVRHIVQIVCIGAWVIKKLALKDSASQMVIPHRGISNSYTIQLF